MNDAERRSLRTLVADLVRRAPALVSGTVSGASGVSGGSGVSGAVSGTVEASGASGAVSGTVEASGAFGAVSGTVPAASGAVSGTVPGVSGGAGVVSGTLTAAVRRHLLGPLAHRAGWPGFRGDHAAASIQADRRAAVTLEAVAALADAGIAVMLLKGIAYAGTLYPDPALRPMSDVDLLVPADRYGDAIGVLGRLGYWHAGTPDQLSGPNHGFTLKRKDGAIDVHRHITHAGRTSIDLEALWSEARPASIRGALRAAPSHEYLIHVAHMARHELAVPAINLVDAALLREAAHRASTRDLEALAERWRIGRGHRAVARLLGDLEYDRPARPGILPSIHEILEGNRPGRALQVARKVALTDDLRGVAALVSATVRGRLDHLRARD